MKQKVADIKNSYKSGLASASKGAALIEYFVEKDKTLVHLYISWLSQNIFNNKTSPSYPFSHNMYSSTNPKRNKIKAI